MATKKDMRRPDLVIPYQAPVVKENPADFSSAMSSTIPMAAMFTRNKYIGWASVVFAIQSWLGESAEARKAASQPAYLSVGMAFMALAMTYLPLFLPPPANRGQGSGPTALPTS